MKRGYCPKCLEDLGVLNSPKHLRVLEAQGKFPRRIGPLMWDADEVDDWFEQITGSRPRRPSSDH
ncbi:transcriptional regulator [Halovulum dunhuangense]|uniref:Transcriptional regulator n=2 Tax=Halovulum dunhuangense TaxID=1505036 RepID=A0A849L3Z5_9RHOB|nr:transcriptional regulator [Halovulum dunhuangense]